MARFEVVVTAHTIFDRLFWADQISKKLVELVGGVSMYEGRGSWCSPETDIITHEDHTLLRALVSDPKEIFAQLEPTLREYRESAEQEVVYIIVDDVPYSLNEAVFDALSIGETIEPTEDRVNRGLQDLAGAIQRQVR